MLLLLLGFLGCRFLLWLWRLLGNKISSLDLQLVTLTINGLGESFEFFVELAQDLSLLVLLEEVVDELDGLGVDLLRKYLDRLISFLSFESLSECLDDGSVATKCRLDLGLELGREDLLVFIAISHVNGVIADAEVTEQSVDCNNSILVRVLTLVSSCLSTSELVELSGESLLDALVLVQGAAEEPALSFSLSQLSGEFLDSLFFWGNSLRLSTALVRRSSGLLLILSRHHDCRNKNWLW